jgi:hypothetical protein
MHDFIEFVLIVAFFIAIFKFSTIVIECVDIKHGDKGVAVISISYFILVQIIGIALMSPFMLIANTAWYVIYILIYRSLMKHKAHFAKMEGYYDIIEPIIHKYKRLEISREEMYKEMDEKTIKYFIEVGDDKYVRAFMGMRRHEKETGEEEYLEIMKLALELRKEMRND